ncbi:MAG: cytochrome B [Gammaproteobacteria bacterium]|nr:cytochrome B [Gammaproteobacteria bacterium]
MNSAKVAIWDFPTRIFHWALASSVAYAWFAVEILEDMDQHFLAGYTILALLLFRLSWGVVGTRYVRFANMLYRPTRIVAYLKDWRRGGKVVYAGHNPSGGLAAVVMLALLCLQASTGLFSTDDYYFGPLSGFIEDNTRNRITEFHHLNSNFIWAMVGLHISAILLYRIVKGERLTSAMLTGKKQLPDGTPGIQHSRMVIALVLAIAAALLVYWLANAFTEYLPTVSFDY